MRVAVWAQTFRISGGDSSAEERLTNFHTYFRTDYDLNNIYHIDRSSRSSTGGTPQPRNDPQPFTPTSGQITISGDNLDNLLSTVYLIVTVQRFCSRSAYTSHRIQSTYPTSETCDISCRSYGSHPETRARPHRSSDRTAPTRQHELDPTDLPLKYLEYQAGIGHIDHIDHLPEVCNLWIRRAFVSGMRVIPLQCGWCCIFWAKRFS